MIDISNCYIKFPWTIENGISALRAGGQFYILWTSDNTLKTVNLELWYEPFAQIGTLVGVIAEGLAINDFDMSYTWIVDSFHQGTNEGYRFKIRDVANPQCGDTSIPFTIIDEDNCSIVVMGVNEGFEYAQDEVIPLSFAFEISSGVVDIRLYSGSIPVTGGVIVEDFDTQNGTVIFDWTVTDFGHGGPSFTMFNIRARDSDDEYCVGKSRYFAIAR